MCKLLHVLKNFLGEKYPHINFEFYLSRRTKNVHMGLNYSLLALHKQKQIIFYIEEVWLRRRQDKSFKFMLPQLIHTTKWRFEYIIFRKIPKNE